MEDYDRLIELIEAQGPFKIYQGWKTIGVDGQRPTEDRYCIYNLDDYIDSQTTVLDLGSNVGFMSLRCAIRAKEVHGVERYAYWVEIAKLAAKVLEIENCHFHCCDALEFARAMAPYEFDLVLSLSFHHWGPDVFEKYANKVFKGMLKEGGHLLFESHKLGPREPFEEYAEYLQGIGFAVVKEGFCQCKTNYPRPNPQRKFYMMELVEK